MNTEAAPIRKRRRWPYIGAAIGVIVLLVILFIPTIASLGPARSYVLSKINAKLHGKLQIKSWSLGWTSGFRARDISLRGKNGEILSIKSLSTGLTLPRLIHGNYALGNVTIDGVHFDIQIDPTGHSNIQQAFSSPGVSAAHSGSPDSLLPNISGHIHLANAIGTIARIGSPVVGVSLNGEINISSINQPIENNLSAALESNSSAAGNIAIKGRVAAVQNNRIVDLSKMDVSENISLNDIDLSAFCPLLPIREIDTLAGRADGEVNVEKYPGRGIVAEGEIRAAHVKISGPALRGDRYLSNLVVVKIPGARISPDGLVDVSEPIDVRFDQGNCALAMRSSLAALQNLSRDHAPGADGFISADLQADCAALSRQMPHAMDIRPDLSLKSAWMAFAAKVNLAADHASFSQHMELSHVSGSDDGQAIAISPITLDAGANILPSDTPFPTLQDISVKLASDFASANFHGASLADFSGSARADLAVAQHQLAQIFDFHNWQFQGTVTAALSSRGDVTQQSAPLAIASRIDAENLHITGGVQPIAERSAILNCSGKILRDNMDAITGVDDLNLALQTSDATKIKGTGVIFRRTAFTAAGSLRLNPGGSGWRMLRELHLHVELPDLPRTASLIEAVRSKGVRWTSGTAAAEINLSESHGALGGEAQISARQLAFARGPSTYAFDPIHFRAAGKLSGNQISISQLDGSIGPLATVELVQPVIFRNSPAPSARGEIRLHADLARINALASAWNNSPSPQTLSGQLAMDQTFSTGGSRILARGGGTITDLQVVADSLTQFHEPSVKIINDLAFDSASQSLNFKSCSISMQSSHALDAALSGAIRHLSTTRDFDDVRLQLSYDLSALLTIIAPMLSPADQQALAQYSITGVQKHAIAITGSFPAGEDLEKSLRRIRLSGSIGLDRLDGNGITITHLSPEFTLRDGVFTITGNGPTPAAFNGGAINLVGVSGDLTDPALRISAPPDLQLVHGTNLNATMLGKFGSRLSPVLSNPTQAAGVLDVSLSQCGNFSLGQFIHPPAPGTSTGNIIVHFSVANVRIANNMAVLIGAFSPQTVFNHQLVGNIDNAELSINSGTVFSNMKLRIGKNLQLGFHGNIDLQTQRLHNFILDFPTPLLGDFTSLVHLRQVPTDIPIPITGTTSHYTLDLSGVNHLADLAKKVVGKSASKVEKAVGSGVNHASKFFNGLFHHDDNDQQ